MGRKLFSSPDTQWKKKPHVAKAGEPWINSFLAFLLTHVDCISQSPLRAWLRGWVLSTRSYMRHFQTWPWGLCVRLPFSSSLCHTRENPGCRMLKVTNTLRSGSLNHCTEQSAPSLDLNEKENAVVISPRRLGVYPGPQPTSTRDCTGFEDIELPTRATTWLAAENGFEFRSALFWSHHTPHRVWVAWGGSGGDITLLRP